MMTELKFGDIITYEDEDTGETVNAIFIGPAGIPSWYQSIEILGNNEFQMADIRDTLAFTPVNDPEELREIISYLANMVSILNSIISLNSQKLPADKLV